MTLWANSNGLRCWLTRVRRLPHNSRCHEQVYKGTALPCGKDNRHNCADKLQEFGQNSRRNPRDEREVWLWPAASVRQSKLLEMEMLHGTFYPSYSAPFPTSVLTRGLVFAGHGMYVQAQRSCGTLDNIRVVRVSTCGYVLSTGKLSELLLIHIRTSKVK